MWSIYVFLSVILAAFPLLIKKRHCPQLLLELLPLVAIFCNLTLVFFSARSKSQALSETRDQRNRKPNKKTENHIGYQIRKTACIFGENRKPNAKKRKNRKPQQTPKPKNRSFSVQKPKNRSKKWPKLQNRKSQYPAPDFMLLHT